MKLTFQCWLCVAGLLPGLAFAQTNGPAKYQAIVERNVFGLKPSAPAPSALSPAEEPKEDLLLTGLADLAGSRCAAFMVAEPGKPPIFFTLREGEQNQWLEIASINVEDATVKGILKKSVVRMRTVGAEVVWSFANQQPGVNLRLPNKNFAAAEPAVLSRLRNHPTPTQPNK